MGRNVSQSILNAIKERTRQSNESSMSEKEEQILKDIKKVSNKIVIDGKFRKPTNMDINPKDFNQLSEDFKVHLKSMFNINFTDSLSNKIKIYNIIDEKDIDLYVISYNYNKETLIKNQEGFIGI